MELPAKLDQRLRSHEPGIMGESDSITTAVILPLIQRRGTTGDDIEDWLLLYQVRADDLENQPGEICFPGGIMEDKDETPKATALRETSEELQIPRQSIEIITRMDSMIMPWQLVLHPFAAILDVDLPLKPDSREVGTVFTVPLQQVVDSEPEEYYLKLKPEPCEDFPFERIPGGRDYDWIEGRLPELFYTFENRTVWGITARVTNHFASVLTGD